MSEETAAPPSGEAAHRGWQQAVPPSGVSPHNPTIAVGLATLTATLCAARTLLDQDFGLAPGLARPIAHGVALLRHPIVAWDLEPPRAQVLALAAAPFALLGPSGGTALLLAAWALVLLGIRGLTQRHGLAAAAFLTLLPWTDAGASIWAPAVGLLLCALPWAAPPSNTAPRPAPWSTAVASIAAVVEPATLFLPGLSGKSAAARLVPITFGIVSSIGLFLAARVHGGATGTWSDLGERFDVASVLGPRAPALLLLGLAHVVRSGREPPVALPRFFGAAVLAWLIQRAAGPLDVAHSAWAAASGFGLDLLLAVEAGRCWAHGQGRFVRALVVGAAGAQAAVLVAALGTQGHLPYLGFGFAPRGDWALGLVAGARKGPEGAALCPDDGGARLPCLRGVAAGHGWSVGRGLLREGGALSASFESAGRQLVEGTGEPEAVREVYFGLGLAFSELQPGFVQPLLPLCRRDGDIGLERRDWCEMGAAFGSLRDFRGPLSDLNRALSSIEEGGRPLYARAVGLWSHQLGGRTDAACAGRLPAGWSDLCSKGRSQLDR